jgi:hypothetical protein
MPNTPTTLYTDETQQFFFIVPDDAALPPGKFAIYAPLGEVTHVHPKFMQFYEVTREDAHDWMRNRLKAGAESVSEGLRAFLTTLVESRQKPDDPDPTTSQANSAFAADLLGESVEDLQTDDRAARRGWQRLFDEAQQVYEGATSDSEDDLEQARAIMSGLGDILRKHGIPVSEKWDQLPDDLHAIHQRAQKKDADDERD